MDFQLICLCGLEIHWGKAIKEEESLIELEHWQETGTESS